MEHNTPFEQIVRPDPRGFPHEILESQFGLGAAELPSQKIEDWCSWKLCLQKLSMAVRLLFPILGHKHIRARMPVEIWEIGISKEREVQI